LTRLGREVMAIEHNPELVKDWSGKLTHVVEADSTNIDALRQVGAGDFSTAVVGIGTSVEDSVLTTANLLDLGVGQVWATACAPRPLWSASGRARCGRRRSRPRTARSSTASAPSTSSTPTRMRVGAWPTWSVPG